MAEKPERWKRLLWHGKSKGLNECVVLSVSFNAFSCVEDWEQEDPIRALCRRIAFAAVCSKQGSKLTEGDYNKHFALLRNIYSLLSLNEVSIDIVRNM